MNLLSRHRIRAARRVYTQGRTDAAAGRSRLSSGPCQPGPQLRAAHIAGAGVSRASYGFGPVIWVTRVTRGWPMSVTAPCSGLSLQRAG
jgi:hypothetical protein